MPSRITWTTISLMMVVTASHAGLEPHSAVPETVVRQQAYRCLDGSGRIQYQQQACTPDHRQQTVPVQDDRTAAQQKLAHQRAQQDQDLARRITADRIRQTRQDHEGTAHARRLNVVPRAPASAASHTTLAESQHVISRRRDFRAVSAKTAKQRVKKPAQAQPSQQTIPQAG